MKRMPWIMIACLLLFNACHKANETGAIDLHIDYSINGSSLVCDTVCYVNEAGNRFMINEIQWFISNIKLQDDHGDWITFRDENNIFYIDTDLPGTHLLHSKNLPARHYCVISFTFGLDETDNYSGHFTNPPESNMFWPDPLGGGYHYMKLNGKWLNDDDHLVPVNIHLGVGQNETLTEFYPNHFTVNLPIDLEVRSDQQAEAKLIMIIDNWFRNPNLYDFNTDGTSIMQNQAAQAKLRENGADVFSIQNPDNMKSLSDISKQIMKMAAPKPHFMTWENFKKTLSEIKENL